MLNETLKEVIEEKIKDICYRLDQKNGYYLNLKIQFTELLKTMRETKKSLKKFQQNIDELNCAIQKLEGKTNESN